MKSRNIFFTLLYFVILVITALVYVKNLPIDKNGIFSIVKFHSTNLDIRNYFDGHDPASYARTGWIIFSQGFAEANHQGLFDYWPPGFMLLHAFILFCFGEHAPVVGIIQILAAFSLAVVFNLLRISLRFYLSAFFSAIIPLILLLSSQFRTFMLGAESVLLGETFAISFVLMGLCSLLLACKNNIKLFSIYAGFAFVLSAYFRSQFETFFMFATLNLCIIFMVMLVRKKINQNTFSAHTIFGDNKNKTSPILFILIAILIFHILTVPYKIYQHTFLWVKTGEAMLINNFTSTKELNKPGGEFLVLGGANIPCLVDEKNCVKIREKVINGLSTKKLKQYTIQTLVKHPFKWAYLKLKYLPLFWFSNLFLYFDLSTPSIVSLHFFDNVFNYIFAICFVFSMAWLVTTIKKSSSLIMYWLSSSIVFSYMTIFTIAHYEARYFYFFKFYFFMLALLCMAQMVAKWNERGKQSCSASPFQ